MLDTHIPTSLTEMLTAIVLSVGFRMNTAPEPVSIWDTFFWGSKSDTFMWKFNSYLPFKEDEN